MDFKMTKQTQVRSTEEAPARSEMKLALEALQATMATHVTWDAVCDAKEKAIIAIREALALVNEVDQEQPAQQEPVAWGNFKEDGTLVGLSQHPEDQANWTGRKPLYTSPPMLSLAQRQSRSDVKPLTNEHIERIYNRYGGDMMNCARAIEREHGIYAPSELKE